MKINRQEMEKFYLEGLNNLIDRTNHIVAFNEEAETDEPKKQFKKVDDILKDVDLSELTNKGRMELIEIVLDSAQNSEEEKEEFEDFIEKLLETVEDYKKEKPEEKEPKEEEETEEQKKKKEKAPKKKEEKAPQSPEEEGSMPDLGMPPEEKEK